MSRNTLKAVFATTAAFCLAFVLLTGLALADPGVGIRRHVQNETGVVTETVAIADGYELSFRDVKDAPPIVHVMLNASDAYTWTIGTNAGAGQSTGHGLPFVASVDLTVTETLKISGAAVPVTAKLVFNGKVDLVLVVEPAPAVPPTPTATPSPTPTPVVQDITSEDVELKAGTTKKLAIQLTDGWRVGLDGIPSGVNVTLTVYSGRTFGTVGGWVDHRRPSDGMVYEDWKYGAGWVASGHMFLVNTEHIVWVELTADADIPESAGLKLLTQAPPVVAPVAKPAAAAAPPTGGGGTEPGLWDRLAAWVGRLFWR